MNHFGDGGNDFGVRVVRNPLQVELQAADVRREEEFDQLVGAFVHQPAVVVLKKNQLV